MNSPLVLAVFGAAAGLAFTLLVRLLAAIFFRAPYVHKLKDDFDRLRYEGDSIHIIHHVAKSLQKHMGITQVQVLVRSRQEFLETVYCTQENRANHIRLDAAVFEKYAVEPGTVFLKSLMRSRTLREIFEKNQAEGAVLLHNRGRIFALLLLGKLRNAKKYTRHDFEALKSLYPYFYVFAYFLKNIAFQPLAGVVTKEIHFSEEVIQSIQENIDPIIFSGIDAALYSSTAKKLGGNYADFITINENICLVTAGGFGSSGLAVCMSIVILKTMIRLFTAKTADLRCLLILVNNFIAANLPEGTAFSGVFMLFDFSASVMRYADCGISSLLVYNECTGGITDIHVKGTKLGKDCDAAKIPLYRLAFKPGTAVLAGTGEMHGTEYIKSCLQSQQSSAREVIRRLYDTYALTEQNVNADSCAVFIKKVLEKKEEIKQQKEK